MKTILLILAFIGFHLSLAAQAPQKMSYQAVIRDSEGELLANAPISLKIAIHQGSANGSTVYEETQTATTNINGLVSLHIGTGSANTGVFSQINWDGGPLFIETGIDIYGGSNYTLNTTSEILSVPLAMHADVASSLSGTISESQISDLDHFSAMDITGNESAFSGWDRSAADDFSGEYKDLANKPRLFSGFYGDLLNKPSLYTRNQVDSLIAANGSEGTVQQLKLQNNELSITGGNKVSFDTWDTNAEDDFSGIYKDLKDKPILYTAAQVDSILAINKALAKNYIQSLSLEEKKLNITGGNSISLENWDSDDSDDFSGDYEDLKNKPILYTRAQVDSIKIDMLNEIQKNFTLEKLLLYPYRPLEILVLQILKTPLPVLPLQPLPLPKTLKQ